MPMNELKEEEEHKLKLLVVDADSVTTRTFVKNTLVNKGYEGRGQRPMDKKHVEILHKSKLLV